MDAEYLSLQEAVRVSGIPRMTLWRRIKAGVLPTYQSERNRRVKLVKRSDLEALMQPYPTERAEGKVAA